MNAITPPPTFLDKAEAKLEEYIELLGEVAALNMSVARAAAPTAARDAATDEPNGKAALILSRATVAVQRSAALHARIVDDARGAARAERDASSGRRRVRAHPMQARVREMVEGAITAASRDSGTVARLMQGLSTRMETLDLEAELVDRPLATIVLDICRGLKIQALYKRFRDDEIADHQKAMATRTDAEAYYDARLGEYGLGVGVEPQPVAPDTG